jgi:hypothetical protein
MRSADHAVFVVWHIDTGLLVVWHIPAVNVEDVGTALIAVQGYDRHNDADLDSVPGGVTRDGVGGGRHNVVVGLYLDRAVLKPERAIPFSCNETRDLGLYSIEL